jgi:hypothetical protein
VSCARGFECAECGLHFGGLSGFDAHRIALRGVEYDWRCGTPAELVARGLRQDARGFWIRPLQAPFYPTATAPEARRGAA